MLTKAPSSLPVWASYFAAEPIPVLERTATALAALAPEQDTVAVSQLAPLVLADPMMTVKLLAHVAQRRSKRAETGSETVAQAILMMGIPPFFTAFSSQPVIETVLASWPQARAGVRRVLDRSYRAALFALAFAVHRKDPDAEIIHEAALMHDFTETLLWTHAPTLALEIERRRSADPTQHTGALQRAVLNIELCDLEQELLRAWRLPELLVRITDDRSADDPQARTVLLALRIARHSGDGWDHPALDADFAAAGDLLSLTPGAVRDKVIDLDAEPDPAEPSS
ncbi:MAG: HDOD domain-containing protein [Lautropia sp.]